MMAAKTGPSQQPGRLEPFVGVSLLLHAILLLVLSRVILTDRFVLPKSEGAVVQVIPVAPAPAPGPVSPRPARESSAAGGSGQESKKAPPAAAKVVAEKPKPQVTPKTSAPAPAPDKAQVAPRPAPVSSTSPKSTQQVLTSERGPAVAVAAAPREPAAKSAQPETQKEAEAEGPLTRQDSAGTGGVREDNPPPGPPEPDLTAAMVVDSSPPIYPKNALTYGAQGQVLLEITVSVDGSISSVAFKQRTGTQLDAFAERWVRDRWRFKPSSVKRPYRLTVLFDFAITRDEQGRAQPSVSYRLVSERVTYL
ncbi:MAG: TonB family protein [Bacillota bacterium]